MYGKEAHRREWDDLEGVVVDVEITSWPSPADNPKGRVVEILGYEDDFGVDVEIVIRKHHLPHHFPVEVLQEAEQFERTIASSELAHRRDYRALPIVTIDGETARDFDDAVTVRRLSNGNFELQVHIADVAHYVREGSPIDLEARLRGTSVYFPDRAIPMLPMELSTDLCSLRPQVDRLVLSCVMEIDPQGEIVGYTLNEGIIRSAERMTYTNVNLILEGDQGLRQHYHKYVDVFELMRELALILNRKRVRRGSIDFDLPEPVIEFDENGLMKGVTRSERNIAHRLIEEFMLSANECVASYLEKRQIASLYRIHEKPDPKRVYDFETIAATFGYSLGVGALPVKRVQLKAERRDRYGSGRQAKTDRAAGRSPPHAAHVSEADAEDCGQAGGAHPVVPDAAFAETGALLGGERRPLRAGGPGVHAFHFADPALPRPDRAPHSEGRPARIARTQRRWRSCRRGAGDAQRVSVAVVEAGGAAVAVEEEDWGSREDSGARHSVGRFRKTCCATSRRSRASQNAAPTRPSAS